MRTDLLNKLYAARENLVQSYVLLSHFLVGENNELFLVTDEDILILVIKSPGSTHTIFTGIGFNKAIDVNDVIEEWYVATLGSEIDIRKWIINLKDYLTSEFE